MLNGIETLFCGSQIYDTVVLLGRDAKVLVVSDRTKASPAVADPRRCTLIDRVTAAFEHLLDKFGH